METAPGSAPGNAAPEGSGGNPAEAEAGAGPGPGEDGKDAGENSGDEDIEGGNAFDVADTGREKLDEAASEDEEEEGVPRSRVAQTIDLFRRGEIQVWFVSVLNVEPAALWERGLVHLVGTQLVRVCVRWRHKRLVFFCWLHHPFHSSGLPFGGSLVAFYCRWHFFSRA